MWGDLTVKSLLVNEGAYFRGQTIIFQDLKPRSFRHRLRSGTKARPAPMLVRSWMSKLTVEDYRTTSTPVYVASQLVPLGSKRPFLQVGCAQTDICCGRPRSGHVRSGFPLG